MKLVDGAINRGSGPSQRPHRCRSRSAYPQPVTRFFHDLQTRKNKGIHRRTPEIEHTRLFVRSSRESCTRLTFLDISTAGMISAHDQSGGSAVGGFSVLHPFRDINQTDLRLVPMQQIKSRKTCLDHTHSMHWVLGLWLATNRGTFVCSDFVPAPRDETSLKWLYRVSIFVVRRYITFNSSEFVPGMGLLSSSEALDFV